MLVRPIYRNVSWLLLVVYLPIVLFMGLQHEHGSVLGSIDLPSSPAERHAPVWSEGEAACTLTYTYCPACHFYLSHSLATQSSAFDISADGLHYVFSSSVDPLLPVHLVFSERAPPEYIA